MMPLLTKCLLDDNGEAWTELWVVFDRAAAGPLRRILTFYDFDQRDADDVVMDVWRHLLEDNRKRLASFKGNSQRELKSWLVRVAVNFAHDWICRRLTADMRERAMRSQLKVPDRSGPTEYQVAQLLDDPESVADAADIRKLRILAGFEESDGDPSPRTIQRWTKKLEHRYAKHF